MGFGALFGLVFRRRFASQFAQNLLIHRPSEMGPVAALVDFESLQLWRPFERQIDPIEQGLGTQLSWLSSWADCFNDCGRYEGQA